MTEAVRWRLTFALHAPIDEPPDGASIKIAASAMRLHPQELHLVHWQDKQLRVIMRLPLAEGGYRFLPVFYRRRSRSLDTSTLDAIVFGRMREETDEMKVSLWLLTHDGRAVNCPGYLIDGVALHDLAQHLSAA